MRQSGRSSFSRKFLLLSVLGIFFVLSLCGAECSNSTNSTPTDADQNNEIPQLDDCGFPIVVVPQGCDACHGAPPQTARHPKINRCSRCHGAVINEDFTFVQPAKHKDGTVDYAVGCVSCHGWDQGFSPPQNLNGECGLDKKGIGSHVQMRRTAIPTHQVSCINCHKVPLSVWATGHIDGDDKADITFSAMATANGAKPVWNGVTCSSVYCHGATLKGGDHKDPTWGDTGGSAKKCGACHTITGHDGDTNADCSSCHPTSVDSKREILPTGTHINGVIDIGDSSEH
jgi:predicted CxxxxCH...CXXCH cytochrome family protein